MASIFSNAATARKDTRNNSVIHAEVRSIDTAVLGNIDAGVEYEVDAIDGILAVFTKN